MDAKKIIILITMLLIIIGCGKSDKEPQPKVVDQKQADSLDDDTSDNSRALVCLLDYHISESHGGRAKILQFKIPSKDQLRPHGNFSKTVNLSNIFPKEYDAFSDLNTKHDVTIKIEFTPPNLDAIFKNPYQFSVFMQHFIDGKLKEVVSAEDLLIHVGNRVVLDTPGYYLDNGSRVDRLSLTCIVKPEVDSDDPYITNVD